MTGQFGYDTYDEGGELPATLKSGEMKELREAVDAAARRRNLIGRSRKAQREARARMLAEEEKRGDDGIDVLGEAPA